jgi:GAF domain-containing protein
MAQEPAVDPAAVLHARMAGVDPSGIDLGALLEQLMAATQTLLNVAGAGLLLLDERQRLRYVGASDEGGRALERAQLRHGTGPCFDSVAGARIVAVPDITADPAYRAVAAELDQAGVRSVLAAPVCLGGQPVGALNVYRADACSWSEEEEASARAFAGLLATLLGAVVRSRREDALLRHLRQLLDPFQAGWGG